MIKLIRYYEHDISRVQKHGNENAEKIMNRELFVKLIDTKRLIQAEIVVTQEITHVALESFASNESNASDSLTNRAKRFKRQEIPEKHVENSMASDSQRGMDGREIFCNIISLTTMLHLHLIGSRLPKKYW